MPLRSALSEITQDLNVASHPERIAQLADEYPHAIAIVEIEGDLNEFNCVMYALDLVGAIDPPMTALGRYHMDLRFLTHLVEHVRPQDLPGPEDCALAIYFGDGAAVHVGTVTGNDTVRSKWGSGHVYEHAVWEIPESYGDQVRFYKSIDANAALEIFLDFAGWREKK